MHALMAVGGCTVCIPDVSAVRSVNDRHVDGRLPVSLVRRKDRTVVYGEESQRRKEGLIRVSFLPSRNRGTVLNIDFSRLSVKDTAGCLFVFEHSSDLRTSRPVEWLKESSVPCVVEY